MANTKQNNQNSPHPRPPVVVILGHVDHGKTSLLDYIRKSKVAEKESGGITQHIGAYQIEHGEILRPANGGAKDDFAPAGRKITFIDTPGHEAFSAMRSRGAKVADIAVLVVAADEGIKPQTKEATDLILHLGLPVIVAINKMDKPAALPEKVKKELAQNNVLVESLGGKVPTVLTSAKTGLGINELLEIILLVAEMENLTADYDKPASGIVIESRLDPQRGATATLLVREGTLNKKDIAASESTFGAIKIMENFLGKAIEKATPSTPVLITGFAHVPPVGEEWQTMPSLKEARNKSEIKAQQEKRKREPAVILEIGPEQRVFNLIIKADVFGSLEALGETLKSIPQEEIILRVIKAEVGDITENDVKLAASAKARIYGFRVKSQPAADILAERDKVRIAYSPIIYELIQNIRQDASVLLKPGISKVVLGKLKILATFKTAGRNQIVGGRVTSGKLERGAQFAILRNEEKIGAGKILQLQHKKADVNELTKDQEGGLQIDSETPIEKGDILETFIEEKTKREL